jgi:hypothetical protein
MHKRERRVWPRSRKALRVLILDPAEVLQEPYHGWIVDRSQGGVCLCYNNSEAEEGDVLLVQPASTDAALPWVRVKVKHQRRKASRTELGCEFVQRNSWHQILLVS